MGVAELGIHFVTAAIRGIGSRSQSTRAGALNFGGLVELGIHFVTTCHFGGNVPGQSAFKATRGRGHLSHIR